MTSKIYFFINCHYGSISNIDFQKYSKIKKTFRPDLDPGNPDPDPPSCCRLRLGGRRLSPSLPTVMEPSTASDVIELEAASPHPIAERQTSRDIAER
jgi:hypothetical protein